MLLLTGNLFKPYIIFLDIPKQPRNQQDLLPGTNMIIRFTSSITLALGLQNTFYLKQCTVIKLWAHENYPFLVENESNVHQRPINFKKGASRN